MLIRCDIVTPSKWRNAVSDYIASDQLRRLERHQRQEMDALLETYRAALGLD